MNKNIFFFFQMKKDLHDEGTSTFITALLSVTFSPLLHHRSTRIDGHVLRQIISGGDRHTWRIAVRGTLSGGQAPQRWTRGELLLLRSSLATHHAGLLKAMECLRRSGRGHK